MKTDLHVKIVTDPLVRTVKDLPVKTALKKLFQKVNLQRKKRKDTEKIEEVEVEEAEVGEEAEEEISEVREEVTEVQEDRLRRTPYPMLKMKKISPVWAK